MKWLIPALILATPCLAQETEVPPPFERADSAAGTGDSSGIAFESQGPGFIRVQIEYVLMDHPLLTELLNSQTTTTADASELRKTLQERISLGAASVLETQIVSARNREKALSESVLERIYPTEWTSAEGEADKKAAPSLPVPDAFETRNVGSTLEIEPFLSSDGEVIDLRFSPELVWDAGDHLIQERKDRSGETRITMPDFYVIRLTTALTLPVGKPVLAAAVSPMTTNGADLTKKVMIFVKADVISAE